MSAEGKKIAIGVFCADWRLHQDGVHINNQVKDLLGVDGVDVLALAGPDGITKPGREGEFETLKKNLEVLVGAHKPVAVAFIAHQQCAGNPVSDDEHDQDVKNMLEKFQSVLQFSGDMVALVATYQSDSDWSLKEVARIPAK